jgi:uncharacterized damage-inducible protein DinB
MATNDPLIDMNIHFLQQGQELMQNITDKQYIFSESAYFSSSAGKHMRHVLDHYLSLLDGWTTKIDYDARERDKRIEEDREYAIDQFKQCIDRLKEMPNKPDLYKQGIPVRSNEAETGEEGSWSSSSVNRELQFLIGHTVHHYALVAFILRVQDFSPPKEFGIAPSTLKYEQQRTQES